jgi:hypothetical protein
MSVPTSVRPLAVAVVVVTLLTVAAGVAMAGMSQRGLLFQSKEAARQAPPPGAPGGPGGMGDQVAPNMQYGAANAPQMAAFRPTPVPIERESSKIKLDLVALYGDEQDKELRRYQAAFEGTYVIRRKKLTAEEQKKWDQEEAARRKRGLPKRPNKMEIVVFFPFPGSADTVPEATLLVDGKEPEEISYKQAGVSCELAFLPEQKHEIKVSYRAHGTEDFVYMLEHDERIKQLSYAVTIKGVQRKPVLPPKTCLDPTTALTREGDTYSVAWDYKNLLTQRDIPIEIPAPLFGGDIAHRMPNLIRTGFVSLVLLALLLVSGGVISDKRVTLGQFVLIVLPIIMFYLLLLQFSKYINLFGAFTLAFVLMATLVMIILQRGQGRRFAWTYGVFGLVVIVGMFSAAALLTKGAGTLVTIAVFALVAYLVYAAPKLPVFRARPEPLPRPVLPPPAPPGGGDMGVDMEEDTAEEGEEEVTETPRAPVVPLPPVTPPPPPEPPDHFCAFCGREVAETFSFCPGCGKTADVTHQCEHCGAEICDTCGPNYQHCPGCGNALGE